jgi:hypothetical protein
MVTPYQANALIEIARWLTDVPNWLHTSNQPGNALSSGVELGLTILISD